MGGAQPTHMELDNADRAIPRQELCGSAASTGILGGTSGAWLPTELRWEIEREGRILWTIDGSHITVVNGVMTDPFSYLQQNKNCNGSIPLNKHIV